MVELHLHDQSVAPTVERLEGRTVIRGSLTSISRDQILGLGLSDQEQQEALEIWGDDSAPRRYLLQGDGSILIARGN